MENIEKEIQENHQNVLDILSGFEETRKKAFAQYIAALVFFLLLALIGFIPIFKTFDTIITALAPLLIIAGIFLAFFFPNHIKNKFKSKLKNSCLKEAMKAFGDIKWVENDPTSYDADSNVGLTSELLDKSALFSSFNKRMIDDEFEGKYNEVNFQISETTMKQESGSGKHRSEVTVFQGVVIQFDSNKKVLNRTMVATKGDYMTGKTSAFLIIIMLILPIVQIICEILRRGLDSLAIIVPIIILFAVITICLLYRKGEPLNKVTLEDPEFNKRFNVYSSDEVEARYLVTPSFMERLNSLTTAFGTKKIKCSFFDDKFMIAISTTKDLFEIGKMYKPLTDPETIENFYKEIQAIYDMIDYFKLDEKTGI